MSYNTDVRDYADAALNQGKAAIGQGRVAVEQATAAATVAAEQASTIAAGVVGAAAKRFNSTIKLRRADVTEPAYVAVGAADLVAETLTQRLEALPADVLSNLIKVSEAGRARLTQAQVDAVARVVELRAKFDAGLASAKELRSADVSAKAKGVSEGYLALAKNLFDTLASRGEARVGELRNEPRVNRLLGDVTEATGTVEARVRPIVNAVEARVRPVADTVEARVSPVLEQVVDTVVPVVEQVLGAVRSASPINPVAAVRRPAAKPAARKTPAKKASTQSAPAKKAAAKAPAKKAPAKKAAAKAPAKKAAAKTAAAKTTAGTASSSTAQSTGNTPA